MKVIVYINLGVPLHILHHIIFNFPVDNIARTLLILEDSIILFITHHPPHMSQQEHLESSLVFGAFMWYRLD